MLLFALVGIDYVVHRRGYNLIGWVLIGASGWIKNEGLLILIASWIGVRVVYGRKPATLKALLLAGLIPVCWHVAVRVCGAKLFDYANPWQVDWTRGIKAFLYTLNYFFLSPWESGFVAYLFCFLLAMGLLRLRKLRKRKEMCFTALVSGISMFLYFYVFSVSRAQDFDLHLESALPRLLCFPILLLARSVVNELDGLTKQKSGHSGGQAECPVFVFFASAVVPNTAGAAPEAAEQTVLPLPVEKRKEWRNGAERLQTLLFSGATRLELANHRCENRIPQTVSLVNP